MNSRIGDPWNYTHMPLQQMLTSQQGRYLAHGNVETYPFIGERLPINYRLTKTGKLKGKTDLLGLRGSGLKKKRGGYHPDEIIPHQDIEYLEGYFSQLIHKTAKNIAKHSKPLDPKVEKAFKAWAKASTELALISTNV